MQPSQVEVNQGTSTPSGEREGWAHWATLALLIMAGIAVRLVCLASKPFWFDESFSVEVARIDWRNFLHLLWWREANMSLYYFLLRIWLHFGQSTFFVRSLAALIAAITLPAVHWLARLLYDRRVALIASALFAFNAYDVRYAQEARSYSLFLLLATLSSVFLVLCLMQPSRRNWRGYVVASVMAVYSHFYALLLIACHWLALKKNRPSATGSEESAGQLPKAWKTIAIAVSPLLIFVAKTGAGPIRWIQRPGLRTLLEFFENLSGTITWPLAAMYAAACLVGVASVGKHLWKRDQNWEVWRAQFLLIWLLFPVLLTFLLSFARPVFLGRYMIFCLPPLVILGAAGLARLRHPWTLAAVLALMLWFCLGGVFFVYGHDFDNERDASGAASTFILDHSQPGDAILFHIADTRIPYEFFRSLRAGEDTASAKFSTPLGPEILFPRHGPGLDYRDFTGKPTADFVRTAASAHPRIWVMLMNNGSPEKPDPTTVMLTEVLPEMFPRIQRWQFAKVEVRLYTKQ